MPRTMAVLQVLWGLRTNECVDFHGRYLWRNYFQSRRFAHNYSSDFKDHGKLSCQPTQRWKSFKKELRNGLKSTVTQAQLVRGETSTGFPIFKLLLFLLIPIRFANISSKDYIDDIHHSIIKMSQSTLARLRMLEKSNNLISSSDVLWTNTT